MRSILSSLSLAPLFLSFAVSAQVIVTRTFTLTGTKQTFTVPNCVSSVTADVRGAQGGGGGAAPGGKGGRAQAVITVTPGDILEVWVGGAGIYTTASSAGGFNGGGGHYSQGLGGTGGGASDIRRGPGLTNRIIVAGGGGGGTDSELEDRPGGHGGGSTGLDGYDWSTWSTSGGKGGTQTSGGAAGIACCYSATAGSFGTGGMGAGDLAAGAGGGGGWYGGGGGLFAGGGGGSGYFSPSCLSNTNSSSGYQQGNGLVVLSYTVLPVNALATPSAICSGSATTLSASGMASYTWSGGGHSSTVSVSPAASSAYTVEATSAAGCPALGYVNVNVTSGVPNLITMVSSSDICPGESVVLNTSGASSVTWSGGVTNGVPFQPAGTSVYFVSGQNVCGTSTFSVQIYVHSVSVTASSNPPAICAGQSATLHAGGNGITYTWSPFNSLTCTQNVVVSPASTTVYSVVARNDFGCTATSQLTLQVDPFPVVITTPARSTICKHSQTSLNASGAAGYTWMPGNLSGSSVTVSPSATTVYTVTGRNSAGCKAQAVAVVSVNPVPNISATASKTFVCAGNSVKLVAGGATTYSWSNGQSGSYTYVSPTVSTTYTVTGFNSLNCTDQKTLQVAVFQNPYSIPVSTTACSGSSVTLYASQGGSYSWSTGDCTQTVTVRPLGNTIYTFAVAAYSNGITCSLSGTIQVIVIPSPTVNASVSKSQICVGEAVVLSATGASSYSWQPGGTGAALTVVPGKGTTKFTVTGSYTNGCTATDDVSVKASVCTAVEELQAELTEFIAFPNPSSDGFFLRSSETMRVYLVSDLGQIVREALLDDSNGYKVKITGVASGVYHAYGRTGSGTKVVRVIVE